MKRLFILAAAGLVLLSAASHGAETARARLFCLSLRFAEGTAYGATLDLSSISGTPNGELPIYADNNGYNFGSDHFYLNDNVYGTIPGTIRYLYLPAFTDANSNG